MENITSRYHYLLREFPLAIFPFEQRPMAPHIHDFCELVYIRRGHGLHRHGKRDYPIQKGDCFMIFPGEAHGYLKGVNLSIVNVLFYPRIFGAFLEELMRYDDFMHFFAIEPLYRQETSFRHKLHLNPVQQTEIQEYLHKMEGELKQKREGYPSAAAALFIQFTVFISRCFGESVKREKTGVEMQALSHSVERAITYLEENFSSRINVKEIAYFSSLSPSRLSHLFKEATGISLYDYLIRTRIDNSLGALRTGKVSINEIASTVGFHDSNYFARAFRKTMGLTPTAYRKKALSS